MSTSSIPLTFSMPSSLPTIGGFFFDSVDFRQQVIGGKHCWDMYGWVVPNELIEEFEPIWLARKDGELEGYDYVCASWEDRNGFPRAIIDGDLPEEAYE